MRAGLLTAVVLLLAACAGALQPSSSTAPAATPGAAGTDQPGRSPSASPSSPATTPAASADHGWRELLTGALLGEELFTVRAAANQAQLDELWEELGQDAPAPAVDFANELVLFLGMSGSSTCPERLDGLVVDFGAATVHGRWAEHDPNVPCTDDIQAQGVLIAVDRDDVPQVPFMLSLRAEPICPDCPERPDQMLVDPAG